MITISLYHATILVFYFTYQISNSYNTTISKPTGFSTLLIHRESYNRYVNGTDLLARTINHSRSRLSYLKSILRLPNNDGAETTDIKSTIMAVPSTYLMEIYIGTPPVKQMVMLDTGSDFSWTQCLPCENCFVQNLPIFNSDQSSSYQELRCSDECLKLGNYLDCDPTRSNEKCKYYLSYFDDASSNGELVKETYTIGDTSIPNILHGCGHNNIGKYDEKSTGMIGLGNGPLSFFGQIQNSIGGMFSYCLVPELGSNPNARSIISFGNNEIVYGRRVMSTPLFKRDDSTYYFLTLESISVRFKTIQMRTQSQSQFQSQSQSGNIMIDTGSTITYLPSVVLKKLIEALIQEIDKRPLNVDGELGYAIDTDIPTITFHFADGANLALSKMNTFIRRKKYVVSLYKRRR